MILEFQDKKTKSYMKYLPDKMFSLKGNYTYYKWR